LAVSPQLRDLWVELDRQLAEQEQAHAGLDPLQRLRLLRDRAEEQAALAVVPDDVTVEHVEADGVPCELVSTPGSTTDRALIHLHGGAYIAYSARNGRELAARLSRAVGCAVLVPDYRLAPEHPHPAAVDDSVRAYCWLRHRVPGPIAFSGDSAGGGLALALAVALRDRGLPAPAGLALISPWTDLTAEAARPDPACVHDIVTPDVIAQAAAFYAGGADRAGPLISPLYAELAGLAPIHIEVSGSELIADDSLRLAERARQAGVAVTVEVTDGAPHVFPAMPGTPEADAAVARIAAFLRGRLGITGRAGRTGRTG
jgi:acetyl esterase/lipase